MSFAREVKKELLNIENKPCCEKAQLLGLLHGCSEVSITSSGLKLIIKSHIPAVIRLILPLLKKRYQISPELSYTNYLDLNKNRIYSMTITTDVDLLVNEFMLMPFSKINMKDLRKSCCQKAIVRGLFIAKGSLNDPKKICYHAEVTCKSKEIAEMVVTFLKKEGIVAKISPKRNQYLVYMKKAETISDFLAYIGAESGVFYFEDSRIYRDLNNTVNRLMNCDIANASKTHQYCLKQLEVIAFLEERNHVGKLTTRLQDAIRLRKEYPDCTLQELSEFSDNILGKKMSKSGISHCLKEVMAYYESLVKDKEK